MGRAVALDVAGIGSMVVDRIFRAPRLIGPEEKILLARHTDGSVVRKLHGGVTLNHLAWARVTGARTGVFGSLPDDADGRFLRAGMRSLGIAAHLSPKGSTTAASLVFVADDGARCIYMDRGATGGTRPADIRAHRAFIRRARFVSTEISQLPLDTVAAVLALAREAAGTTVLDVDIPPQDAVRTLGSRRDLERALALADILKPSRAAARELAGGAPPLLAARRLRARYGSRAVAITDGERGCAIDAEGFSGALPAFRVKAVDTTGCGDAFLGGLLAARARGLSWPEAARLANACGAACALQTGAFPAPGTRRTVERLLAY